MQLSEINSRLSTVKFWHSEKTGDWSIGDWQIRLASVSLIPDGVGHVLFWCSGADGGLTVGGSAVSLAVMMTFLSMLQHINKRQRSSPASADSYRQHLVTGRAHPI